jgi:hypothetical protein
VVEHPELFTQPGEIVQYEFPAALLKEVLDRRYQGGYGGVSVRVAKDVTLRSGGVRGRQVVVGSHIEAADHGTLSITSTRVVFKGAKRAIEHQYKELVGVEGAAERRAWFVGEQSSDDDRTGGPDGERHRGVHPCCRERACSGVGGVLFRAAQTNLVWSAQGPARPVSAEAANPPVRPGNGDVSPSVSAGVT